MPTALCNRARKRYYLNLWIGQSRLHLWIGQSIVFNTDKAKLMLLTTKQISVWHKLKDEEFKICCNGIQVKRVNE